MNEASNFMNTAVSCLIKVAITAVICWVIVNITLHFFGQHVGMHF